MEGAAALEQEASAVPRAVTAKTTTCETLRVALLCLARPRVGAQSAVSDGHLQRALLRRPERVIFFYGWVLRLLSGMHERSTYPIPDSFSISEQGERLEGNFMGLRDVRRLRGEFPPAPVVWAVLRGGRGPCDPAGIWATDRLCIRSPIRNTNNYWRAHASP